MTREQILEVAAQIFSQKGFHATSMQDIAQAVNLQKASLYHHVASKQDILVALLDQALDLLIAKMQEVLARPLPSDEKLRQAMITYMKTMLDHRDLASVLLLEYRSLEPQWSGRHKPRRDRFEHLWRDLIQEGCSLGMFDCSDPALTSRALLGVMNWTITWYNPEGALPPEKIAEHFANLFLRGLLARPNADHG